MNVYTYVIVATLFIGFLVGGFYALILFYLVGSLLAARVSWERELGDLPAGITRTEDKIGLSRWTLGFLANAVVALLVFVAVLLLDIGGVWRSIP